MNPNVQVTMGDEIYTERAVIKYSDRELAKIDRSSKILQLELEDLAEEHTRFPNQKTAAEDIVNCFDDKHTINVMVLGKTQSGKTGGMVEFVGQYAQNPNNNIPPDHIYVVTGLSSVEWKDQTKERFPRSLRDHIYHRSELTNESKFVYEVKGKKNIMIIMDEVHVAAKDNQTIYKAFEAAELLDIQKLYMNDVKILEYTATPDGTIHELMKWNEKWPNASQKVMMQPGEGYTGIMDLYKMGKVKQYKELCVDEKDLHMDIGIIRKNIEKLRNDVDSYGDADTRYHIVRTRTGASQDSTISLFKDVCGDRYNYVSYDRRSDIQNINSYMKERPEKHTFIFIKEMLRCAKTLTKTFMGVLHERYTKHPDDSAIIQGLSGRNTGYDVNHDSIIYTNIDTILRYEQLWESAFNDVTVRWNSKTTKFKNGEQTTKKTFNHAANYDETSSMDSEESGDSSSGGNDLIRNLFDSFKKAKEYIKTTLGGHGPKTRIPNADGFYEAVIRSRKEIYDIDSIRSSRKYGLNKKSKFRLYPCYTDVTDNNTLQWLAVHK